MQKDQAPFAIMNKCNNFSIFAGQKATLIETNKQIPFAWNEKHDFSIFIKSDNDKYFERSCEIPPNKVYWEQNIFFEPRQKQYK